MNYLILIEKIICIAILIAVYMKVDKLYHEYMKVIRHQQAIGNVLRSIMDYCKKHEEHHNGLFDVLATICNLTSATTSSAAEFMGETSCSLHNIMCSMIPLLEDYRQDAIDSEDFERAQEYSNILLNIESLLNPKEEE